MKAKTAATPTRKFVQHTTELKTSTKLSPTPSPSTTAKLRETTTKVLIETTSSRPSTVKFVTTTTEGRVVLFGSDGNIIENEAETLPNIEIIPFVAHDAIDTDKFEPYHKSYDNLEKDYFATEKVKPIRYNNRFSHHSYDEPPIEYANIYSNPHERIDTGPYYFESNENQFDAFSPPSEHEFLGEFLSIDDL